MSPKTAQESQAASPAHSPDRGDALAESGAAALDDDDGTGAAEPSWADMLAQCMPVSLATSVLQVDLPADGAITVDPSLAFKGGWLCPEHPPGTTASDCSAVEVTSASQPEGVDLQLRLELQPMDDADEDGATQPRFAGCLRAEPSLRSNARRHTTAIFRCKFRSKTCTSELETIFLNRLLQTIR